MNLFIAGLYTANFVPGQPGHDEKLNEREKTALAQVAHKLESYHYIHKQATVDRIRAAGEKVFLDSGAFSAFSLGVAVDIVAYCDYIKRNIDIIRFEDSACMASVLDGIGDAQKTYENQLYMESLGVRPLPCFHYGEDWRYLEHYLANYEYITIGGMVPISTPQLFYWLDELWGKYLCDGSGRAKIKVHGFGLTSVPLMERYPWYSVDSSSWVQIGAHGNIIMDGKTIAFSSKSPNARVAGQHVDTLPTIQKDAIDARLVSQGFDPTRMRENTYSRWAYNAWQYAMMGLDIDRRGVTFINEQQGLFV